MQQMWPPKENRTGLDGSQAEKTGGKDTVIFLHENLREAGNGVEIAGLRRAWLFARDLSIPVDIYTASFNPKLRSHEASLRTTGQLVDGIRILNLYEMLAQECLAGLVYPLKSMRGDHPIVAVSFMKLPNGQRVTRQTFHLDTIDEVSGCIIFEEFFVENTIFFRKGYAKASSGSVVAKVFDIRLQKNGGRRFRNESEFVCDTLCRQLEKNKFWHVLIDKNRMYRRLPQAISRHGIQATLSPIIHSTHLRKDGQVKNAYSHWLQGHEPVDAIIVHTQGQKAALAEVETVREKLRWIPHTLPQWPREKTRKISTNPTVLYAARYEREKRHELLFEAFRWVCKKVPNAELHTYGTGQEYQNLLTWVVGHQMQAHIHVHPATAHVGELCTKAWCGVLTSVEESFSLFTLECLAHGCPVVAFDINYGPKELLNGDQGGILVPDGDARAFADALVQLLSNQAVVEAKSEGAWAAAQPFSPDRVVQLWADWYRDMVSISHGLHVAVS